MRPIKHGSADQSTVVRIVDSSDGTPETGVTSATAGLSLSYRREGAAAVALTESDLAAADSAHSDGGMFHLGSGYYRVDLPDAACATGAAGVAVFGDVTGMVVIGSYHPLVANVEADTYARLGAPAGASVSADVAAVKTQTAAIETDTQDIQGRLPAALTASGYMKSDVLAWDGAAVPTEVTPDSAPANFDALLINASGHLSRVTLVDTTTTNTDMITAAGVRSAVGLASANLDTQLGTIDTVADAVKEKTDQLTSFDFVTAGTSFVAMTSGDVFTEAALANAPAGDGGLTADETQKLTDIHEIVQAGR